jgi:glycerol-3-phosphate cytidylyltransferase
MLFNKRRRRKKEVVGYTAGVFDLFHIGHLNILRNAKNMCDKLIVGVTTDELVSYKFKKAVIPFNERAEIIRSLKYVDVVVPQHTMDKFEAWNKLKFDVMFVGDDWFNTEKWVEIEQKFKEVGVRIVYFPYTKGTSSTMINEILFEERQKMRKVGNAYDKEQERQRYVALTKKMRGRK